MHCYGESLHKYMIEYGGKDDLDVQYPLFYLIMQWALFKNDNPSF